MTHLTHQKPSRYGTFQQLQCRHGMVCRNSYVIFRNSAKSNIPGSDSLSQVAVICPHTSRAKRSWVQHQSCFSCAKSRNSTKLQVANLDQNGKNLNFLDPKIFPKPSTLNFSLVQCLSQWSMWRSQSQSN